MQLMTQIDGLISTKQREWESSMRGLQTQLQHRERDIASMKVKLQERNSQVNGHFSDSMVFNLD